MNLPIRVRLTAWYALLLAAILVALGAFLVLRLRSDLRSTITREIRDGAVTIGGNYANEGVSGFREISAAALPRSGSATQVLDGRGRVLVSYGAPVAERPMLSPTARAAAFAGRGGQLEVRLGRSLRPFQVMASPVRVGGRTELLVVAESLDQIDEAVRRILVLLLLAAPAALATAGVVGWWLLRKALAPVQRMTQKADDIGIDQLGERLAAPNPNDEVGRLAGTLNAMLDRLERGFETRQRLVADASHELRTPLAVMRAELDVRLRREDLTSSERDVLESVREETDRMGRSVDNLLTLAQAEEGKLSLLSAELDLAEVIESAARPLRGLAAANRIELSIQSEPCRLVGDPQRLELALTNLIENAIKFTPAGGEIVVACERSAGRAGVTVRDSGPGISGEVQARVFDRFYRARARPGDRTTTVGGGLGLAICKEIAAAHGGTITVRSQEGRGSAFTLWLPDHGAIEGEENPDGCAAAGAGVEAGERTERPDARLPAARSTPLK
jgi:heavy metal sensor kinase